MGTWGIGPFDNDTAADFADQLDDAKPSDREARVRAVFIRQAGASLRPGEFELVVAAAALVAAQCPGGRPVDASSGPRQPLPGFSKDLCPLAAEALDRVLAEEWSLPDWRDPADARHWVRSIKALQRVLVPTLASVDVPLFDL